MKIDPGRARDSDFGHADDRAAWENSTEDKSVWIKVA
jgi:hypothetical protein